MGILLKISEATAEFGGLLRRKVRIISVFNNDFPKVLRKFDSFILRKCFRCFENFGRTHGIKINRR